MKAAIPLYLTPPQVAMLRSHVTLVRRVVHGVNIPSGCYDDVMQAGMIGLTKAIQRYDPNHPSGAKLSTYAIRWIRVSISREIAKHRSAPARLGLLAGVFARVVDEDDAPELELELELQREVVHDLQREPAELERDLVRTMDMRRILGFVADLPAVEAEVVRARFRGEAQTEVGDRMQVSRQRISQIERSAVRGLRQRWSTLARAPRMSA